MNYNQVSLRVKFILKNNFLPKKMITLTKKENSLQVMQYIDKRKLCSSFLFKKYHYKKSSYDKSHSLFFSNFYLIILYKSSEKLDFK